MPANLPADGRPRVDLPRPGDGRSEEGRGPGRPKDLSKRAAILDTAKRLFVAHGFDGVSMDTIAGEAGVSKLTVYSHFGDKHTLFGEAIASKCCEQMPDALFASPFEGDYRQHLREIARAFFGLITSHEALAMHRMMQMPGTDVRLQELFWNAGPARVQAAFAHYLAHCVERGELRIPDVHRAATQFFALLKGEMHMKMMCGLCVAPDPQDIETHIDATVDLFLRAHGAPAGTDG